MYYLGYTSFAYRRKLFEIIQIHYGEFHYYTSYVIEDTFRTSYNLKYNVQSRETSYSIEDNADDSMQAYIGGTHGDKQHFHQHQFCSSLPLEAWTVTPQSTPQLINRLSWRSSIVFRDRRMPTTTTILL